jgi:hypothetical protein
MFAFSKKLIFFSGLLMFSVVIAKKTKKLQLIVDPNNIAYFFALNAGNGIDHNPGAARVQGSYYITNAFIFPGGTVSKKQASFLVDKEGHPLNFNTDSIGVANLLESVVQTLDFSLPLPVENTLLGMIQWQLEFSHSCEGDLNSIFLTGFDTMGNFNIGEGKASFIFYGTIVGGLGCNKDDHHNNFTAKVYIGANGLSSLVKVKFDEEIEYKD